MVLDCACSSTVCGQKWLDGYISSLSDEDKLKIKEVKSQRCFRFGGGPLIHSKAELILPAQIGGIDVSIKTDVVDSDVPLLFSKSAMKNAGMDLFVTTDEVLFRGQRIALNETSSGHYCLPINRAMEVDNVFAVNLLELDNVQLKKSLKKLHAQFGHPAQMSKLIDLMKGAKSWNERFRPVLEEVYVECDLCKQFKKTPARPVVALPMASEFNEVVCMDLKKWNNQWILHMIDMHTRYTQSVFINRKLSTTIIDNVMVHWTGIFGIMKGILTDNGGEFTSDEMREVASILDVDLKTTAAESPWQNGLCERVHQVTDMILLKLQAQYPRIRLTVLLKWANLARNSLQMWNGFSSHQLVFGKNPNLPDIMTAKVPALEEFTSSEVFAKHLNALHAAREAYIQSEASERIRRALRHRIRASQQVFHTGERVYYKRDESERWLGPGKVLFQDGKVVFVRHGNIYVRVSVNRLVKASGDSSERDKLTLSRAGGVKFTPPVTFSYVYKKLKRLNNRR